MNGYEVDFALIVWGSFVIQKTSETVTFSSLGLRGENRYSVVNVMKSQSLSLDSDPFLVMNPAAYFLLFHLMTETFGA